MTKKRKSVDVTTLLENLEWQLKRNEDMLKKVVEEHSYGAANYRDGIITGLHIAISELQSVAHV